MRFAFGLTVDDNILPWIYDEIFRRLMGDGGRLRHCGSHDTEVKHDSQQKQTGVGLPTTTQGVFACRLSE